MMKELTVQKKKELRTLQDKLVLLCEASGMQPYDEVLYRINLDNLKHYIYPDYEDEIRTYYKSMKMYK